MRVASKVKIMKDTCEGFYEDLIGKEVQVLEYEPYEEEEDFLGESVYEMFYLVGAGRPSSDPYKEGRSEELVWEGDIEVTSYIEV